MADIVVNHEAFDFYKGKVQDYEAFLAEHEGNIKRFRSILKGVLLEEEGKFIFEYSTKHHQFDPVEGPRNLSKDEVRMIEGLYPNCFI